MYQLILPDGRVLAALGNVTLERAVNDGEDLALGSACAAMLQCTLYGQTAPGQGTELRLTLDGADLGLFRCEKPRRTGENRFSLTAYDRMVAFDVPLQDFLAETAFPITLGQLLERLCAHCGVPLGTGELPGSDLTVRAFEAPTLTGRQLLRYIGQAAGRYFTVDASGSLCPGWYTPTQGELGRDYPYAMGSLTQADYAVAPVQRVWLRASENDVGTVYPDGSGADANTLILQGNPLLPPDSAHAPAVARRLYEQLQSFSYTPFRCTLLPGALPEPGQMLTLPEGSTGLVMTQKRKGRGGEVSATGNPSRSSTTAFNTLTYGDLTGRMLTVERSVSGLKVENANAAGDRASLSLAVEGITSRVTAVEQKADAHADKSQLTTLTSQLSQRADSLEFSVTQVRTDLSAKADRDALTEITELFRFDMDGLTITNSASGMGIGISEQRVVFTGGENPTTAIYPNEMETTNLRVGSRLDLGSFSLIPRTNGNLSLRCTA